MAQESWKLELDQEDTSCQPPEGPFYCANKCGFFGSKATMNMCSKCYRDLVLAQANESSANGIAETCFSSQPGLIEQILLETRSDQVEPVISKVAEVLKSTVEGNRPARVFVDASPSRAVNRCFACDKRVGLTGFKCRCGDFFCSLHRYSDKHNCTFDYKSAGRDAILKANPVVKADKIEKI